MLKMLQKQLHIIINNTNFTEIKNLKCININVHTIYLIIKNNKFNTLDKTYSCLNI